MESGRQGAIIKLRAMLRLLIAPLAALLVVLAGTRLYLKDGTFHEVREYKVEVDRVRYYSIERSDWEEIPLDLVDLKRTESESKQRQEEETKAITASKEEEEFERQQRAEIKMIPREAGVYMVTDGKLRTFPAAEIKVHTSKGRNILKILSPVPLVAGKSWVEIDGESSKNLIEEDRPNFYFRLAEEERFGIVRAKKKKGVRVVEELNIVPVSNEIFSERDSVDIFRQQVREGLYKIWPVKPLDPGEYAVVEFTEGKVNTQAWDFGIPAKGTP
jgi:hypothetical protein